MKAHEAKARDWQRIQNRNNHDMISEHDQIPNEANFYTGFEKEHDTSSLKQYHLVSLFIIFLLVLVIALSLYVYRR